MIGSLRGKITLRDGHHLIVDVGGVGYKVLVSDRISSKMSENSNIYLFTYTYVREDSLELFGFLEISELKLFENLISVSGVGPKTAMSIFSFATKNEVVDATLRGDVAFFTRVPRLGTKNAQKIIIELRNKLGDNGILDLSETESKENSEVVTALKNFGFSSKEASDALRNLDEKAQTTEEKIKLALKYLGK